MPGGQGRARTHLPALLLRLRGTLLQPLAAHTLRLQACGRLALFFAGVYRAATSRALHQHRATYALTGLGAGMIGAGLAMLAKGIA